MAESLIALEALSKSFPGDSQALDGVSLEVPRGQFVSLLGPSGCGKSTLLRLVAGLLQPTSGRVRLAPELEPRGRIGFVFQDATLLPWATVADNASLALRLLHAPEAQRRARVEQALELVGLAGFAKAYPRELSGGMRMRVSLARALAQQPRLLLLDEPFAALDELTRFKLNDDLRRLWRHEDWTVLFVTHSVFESVYLSERVLLMTPRPGRLAADLRIELPAERDPATRTSPAYVENCRLVSERLAQAMAA